MHSERTITKVKQFPSLLQNSSAKKTKTFCHLAFKFSTSLPAWAMRTTSEWDESRTLTSLMLMRMSPTWSPDSSAGVPGSMAETTTGRDPWIRNPNSPDSLLTKTISSHSIQLRETYCYWLIASFFWWETMVNQKESIKDKDLQSSKKQQRSVNDWKSWEMF